MVGWAEFSLERFRVLGLWLRSSDRGKAALLRVQAEGTPHGTPQREELLRHAAEADPEQRGIWGELGIAQAEIGKRPEAEASLNTARERQPDASSTLKLEALITAAQGNWTEAGEPPSGIGQPLACGVAKNSRRVAAGAGSRS